MYTIFEPRKHIGKKTLLFFGTRLPSQVQTDAAYERKSSRTKMVITPNIWTVLKTPSFDKHSFSN